METLVSFLTLNIKILAIYLFSFVLSSFFLYFIAKNVKGREKALSGLLLVQSLLEAKLGEKATAILTVWIEGLHKIQDGEFSSSDGVDQFLRYIRLAIQNYGIQLSDREIDILHTIIMSTLNYFVKSEPKHVEAAVSKFNVVTSFSFSNKV